MDLEKAYDHLERAFVEETLRDVRLPDVVGVIMRIVSSGYFRLLWNGEETYCIQLGRGLRQGDPLSPYLFVLCMERLGHWLWRKVEEGELKEMRASRGGPVLSFLFFADDLLLFSEASEEQMACLREGLNSFCKASSQRVNFSKSSMLCSTNVSEMEVRRLSQSFGVPLTKRLGKYLGHHVLQVHGNGEAHKELVERVRSRLEG